jgi:nucleotide-binding universal stress UspA family protein
MVKILMPIDGSAASDKAVADFIQLLDWYKETPEIHLLNVQLSLHGDISMFIDKETIQQFHQENGMKKLQNARDLFNQAGLSCQYHITVGDPAEIIVQFAKERFFDQIVIGARGLGAVKSLLLGSVASKLIKLSSIPVLVLK